MCMIVVFDMFTHPNHLLQKKLTDYKIIMRDDFADLENEVNTFISHLCLSLQLLTQWYELEFLTIQINFYYCFRRIHLCVIFN